MSPLARCLALVILGAGGGEQAAAQSARPVPASETPFAFCARVGTDDRLGSSHGAASSWIKACVNHHITASALAHA
jgi:hypothetical protein